VQYLRETEFSGCAHIPVVEVNPVTGQVKILRYIAASCMDYLLPTAQEVPRIEIGHVETPSPFTEYGVKGGGEGGRMIAPAALASAVEDALAPLGVTIAELPMTPERLATLVEAAQRR